jgi:hypothetical protein
MKFTTGRGYCLSVFLFFCIWGNQCVFALNASIGPDGCNAQAVHTLGYTGQGVEVGVGVGVITLEHCLVTHEAFFDKDALGNPIGSSHAHYYDPTEDTLYPDGYEPYWHDTSMAGIIASRGGYLYPTEIGVAPDSEIYSIKVTKRVSATDPNRLISTSWIEDGLDHLISNQSQIAVTGFQLSGTADGGSQYSLLYDYYAYTNDLIFINAAGNDATGITIFGDAFNGITTAGLITTDPNVYRRVGSASNPGPTADNRRKPEIASPAQNLWVPTSSSNMAWKTEGTTRGETSWAGPHAAGVAALLIQYATESDEDSDSKSEVIKAVMVNSVFPNIQDETNTLTTGQLWHPQRGYGRIDALRALQLLSQPKVTTNIDIIQSAGWAYTTIGGNQTHTYQIYAAKNSRLAITSTWHRLVTRNYSYPQQRYIYSAETPPFNLNLSIVDPNGILIASDSGTLDNLRRADILLPIEGIYQVQIANTTTKNGRDYAMAFEILPPLAGDFYAADYIVDTSDLTLLTGHWLEQGCLDTGALCHSFDLVPNGQIDLQDIAILATNWLSKDMRYYPQP